MKHPIPARWAAVGIAVMLFSTVPSLHAQPEPPYFEPADCPVAMPDDVEVECGTLTVREDHTDPRSGAIRLMVVRLHSRTTNPAPDPILYTEGGPGYSSLTAVYYLSRTAMLDERDIIVLEQRGNRYAQPSLMCDASVWWEEAEGNTACLNSLRAQSIDLTHYTAQQIVEDIEALRVALGIKAWNLYGSSFSTRLMLLTMQQHPEAVRSAILDSALPPNENRYLHDPAPVDRVLSQMFDDCAADPACAAAYPDLEARFYTLFSRLNAEPVTVTIADDAEGHRLAAPHTELVSGYTLLEWMVTDAFYGSAYDRGKATYLPLLIDRVEAGQVELLTPWVNAQLYDLSWLSPDFAWGLYFAVGCQNDYPAVAQSEEGGQQAAYPALEGYRRYAREVVICELWGLPAVPLGDQPVASDIPTLILADSYDPVTPPEWGERTAVSLPQSYTYQLPATGHSRTGVSLCVQSIMHSFVADPTHAPDASCLAAEPRPAFVLPQDVLIAPGFYRTLADFDLGVPRGKPWLEVLLVAALLVFVVELGYLLVAGIIWLVHPRGRRPAPDRLSRVAQPLAGMLAVGGLSVPVLLTLLNHQLNADPTMRFFGLPADNPLSYALGAVSPMFAVLTAALVLLLGFAWMRRWWSSPKRVLFSLVVGLAVVFSVVLARWGLIAVLL